MRGYAYEATVVSALAFQTTRVKAYGITLNIKACTY